MKNTLHVFRGLCAFGCIVSTLTFTSCSENLQDENVNALSPETQEPAIALKERLHVADFIQSSSPDLSDMRTTEAPGVDKGRYNITLKYVTPPTPRQEEVFEAAAARWERIIIKDVPSIQGPIPSAFAGFPDIEGTIDDIVIEVALAPIDGPGGILGQAGPNYVRSEDFLSLSGIMFFDVADLASLEEVDLFEEVIVHEMGHVLGIGTLWNVAPYGVDRTLRAGPNSNPYFTGKKANVFWNAEGGDFELPIENGGGSGTALSHWRESVLNNELMTGYLNLGENPISRITAGSMKDLGYGAASVGESYDLPKGTQGVDISELGEDGSAEIPGLHIAKMEVLLQPVGFVSTKK